MDLTHELCWDKHYGCNAGHVWKRQGPKSSQDQNMQSLLAQLVQAMPGWDGCMFWDNKSNSKKVVKYTMVQNSWKTLQYTMDLLELTRDFQPKHPLPAENSPSWWQHQLSRSAVKIHPDDPFLDPSFIGLRHSDPLQPFAGAHATNSCVPRGRCSMRRPLILWWSCKMQWKNCGKLSSS